ncbi:hypothetical protein T5B8_11312 [Salinisphaera sp. T5B8]|uniref:hypothetical protein n=1 Tax=Salinisphaera sp. T5B8 TaxID=1304154 RepID=UPI00333EF611
MSQHSTDANSDYTPGLDRLTRYALVALAVAQALALYGLAQASDAFDAPRWLYGAYVVAGLLPLLFYLGCERLYDIRNLIAAVLLAPLLFGLGWHLGWLCEPFENHSSPTDAFLLSFALSMGAAVFVLASYLRAWTAQHKPVFDYPQLLIYTHEQLFCIVLVSVFLGIAWGLLTLWAMLFDAIGITLFSQLLNNELFGYLCNGLIAGIALVVIRNQPRLIATLSAITRALLRVLLVPVALAIVLFALALPWVGVEQIWATGRAASLMMMLSVVLLALFATAFLEAPQETGYPRPLRALVWGAVILLPLNVVLASWALGLRIGQHGLSVDRLWAVVLLALIASYALSYALVILWSRAKASARLQRINVVMGLVVAGTLILVNTPLADLRALSAHNQAQRLTESRVAPAHFDYNYLRNKLGAYGVAELKRLRDSDFADGHPRVAQRIAAVLDNPSTTDVEPTVDTTDPDAIAATFNIVPGDTAVPAEFITTAAEAWPECLHSPGRCTLVRAQHPNMTFWWVFTRSSSGHRYGSAYAQIDGEWRKVGPVSSHGCGGVSESENDTNVAPQALPGPFVAFKDKRCFYVITPDDTYLRDLSGRR